jgi:predicted  nucleic acid-binding Zn-ribbon protein
MQNDIDRLRDRADAQDVKYAKVESAIETLVKQGEQLGQSIKDFTTAIQGINLTLTEFKGQNTNTNRAVTAVVSVILLIVGSIAGQFIHFHP